MKTGAADWFHKDQYENGCKGKTGRVVAGRTPRRFRPLQPKWLRRRSRLQREACLYNSVNVISRQPSFYRRLVEFFAVG